MPILFLPYSERYFTGYLAGKYLMIKIKLFPGKEGKIFLWALWRLWLYLSTSFCLNLRKRGENSSLRTLFALWYHVETSFSTKLIASCVKIHPYTYNYTQKYIHMHIHTHIHLHIHSPVSQEHSLSLATQLNVSSECLLLLDTLNDS